MEKRLYEIKRRLRALERTPILPNVSTSLGITGALVDGLGQSASAMYGNLDDVVGPSVTVEVRGRNGLVVIFGSWFSGFDMTGYTSFTLSGANSLSPDDTRALWQSNVGNELRAVPLSGLNPGETTITLKYRRTSTFSTAGQWKYRRLVVIPF